MADNWTPENNPVDYIILQGKASPGLAELVGVSAPRNLQVQTGMGYNDALVRFAGFSPQKFSVKFHLYDEFDWAEWHNWKPLVQKRVDSAPGSAAAKVAAAMTIVHPFLNDPTIGITAVIVEDVLAPVRADDTGEWVVEVKFISYRKPKIQYLPYEEKKDASPTGQLDKTIADNRAKIAAALAGQKLPAP